MREWEKCSKFRSRETDPDLIKMFDKNPKNGNFKKGL